LGFNSAKLATYHVDDKLRFTLSSQEDAKVKLGEELDATGFLGDSPMDRTLRVLKLFRRVLDFESPRYVLPIATSAVREAANRDEFLRKAEEATGFKFRVVSAGEEALLSYLGAASNLKHPTGIYFDLGGGTLALVQVEDFKVKKVQCLPLGARRLTYLYANASGGWLFDRKGYRRMQDCILAMISGVRLPSRRNARLVGVGGTVRALARYHRAKSRWKEAGMGEDVMSALEVARSTGEFSRMKKRELLSLPSIGRGRAETMQAGSCVINLLIKAVGARDLTASPDGLREGALTMFLHDRRWFKSKKLETITVDRLLAGRGGS
jgi:exopolyphosphatase/guanosine-5'-triphosphate,3'-diphosphate pyrophosphatase